MLEKELSTATNIKRKGTRNGVKIALKNMINRLKMYRTVPENGIAIFGGNKEYI